MWALAFDSAICLLRSRLRGPRAEMSLFADDNRGHAAHALVGLPPLLWVFDLLAAAAGLIGNYSTTLVVNYSGQASFLLKRRLLEAIGLARLGVARIGLYLGVLIGPEAVASFWNAAVSKLSHRCALLRTSLASCRQRVAAIRAHAASFLLYLAQISELPRVVDEVEAATIAPIASAPMHAFSASAILHSLGGGSLRHGAQGA